MGEYSTLVVLLLHPIISQLHSMHLSVQCTERGVRKAMEAALAEVIVNLRGYGETIFRLLLLESGEH